MAGYTLSQLESIEAAIGSGVLTVEHQGTRTTYQSLGDLIKTRDLIKAELIGAGLLSADSTSRVSYVAHSRD